MTFSPYISPLTFGRRETSFEDAKYVLLGVPYDSSETYRTGSRFAPGAIREASREIEDYDVQEDFNLSDISIHDAGDVEVSFGDAKETRKRVRNTVRIILDEGKVPVLIGGEHTITPFAIEAFDEKPFFVVFDAHLDFRDDYINNKWSHACIARRVGEMVGFENCLSIGARSIPEEEVGHARDLGFNYLDFNSCGDIDEVLETLRKHTKGKKVYLSIDADALDPKEMRGVGNPEPPGFSYTDMLTMLDFLEDCNLVGFDINEIIPMYDSYSPVLGAKLIFKALMRAERGK